MDIKVRPGGLRLKFEPHAQPFLGPKFGCKILHFTVQYRSERAACAASGFSRAKTLAENFNCQFGTLTGRSFFPSRTSCIHNNPRRTLFGRRACGTTDDRNAGATQHNRNALRICLTDHPGRKATSCFRLPLQIREDLAIPQCQ